MQADLFEFEAPAPPARLSSPFKWPGSKREQVDRFLMPLYQPHRHRRLVEPFVGGCNVALGLRPADALLNDANPHVINFYSWVQRGLAIEIPMANDPALFDGHRVRFNELIGQGRSNSAESASLFYYLLRNCYNGLPRFNQQGRFNTPFGRYATVNYRREFSEYAAAFANWVFTAGDFEDVQPEPDDFVYVDPPYAGTYDAYTQDGFGWADQCRLVRWLARHPGPVVAANAATPRIIDLYTQAGFSIRYLDASRRISANGDRTPAREMLATRNVEPRS